MYDIFIFSKDILNDWNNYSINGDLVFSFDINEEFIKTYYYDSAVGRNILTKHKYNDNQITLQYNEVLESKISYFEITFNTSKKMEFKCDVARSLVEFNGIISDSSMPKKFTFESKYMFFANKNSVDSLEFVSSICRKIIQYIK